MTALKMEIISALDQVPENKLEKVLDFIKNLLGDDENTPEMKAYEDLKKISAAFKGKKTETYEDLLETLNLKENPEEKFPDYRDEVAREVLKKYASIA